jgi:hypothetical protein
MARWGRAGDAKREINTGEDLGGLGFAPDRFGGYLDPLRLGLS